MKTKIAIIDYGMGNVRSVQKALEYVGYQSDITQNKYKIYNATHIVVPGQGAFGDAKHSLEENQLTDIVISSIASGKLYLGICLGMQLLFSKSFENGIYDGFNIIPGDVVRFGDKVKVPHIGWNQLKLKNSGAIFAGIKDQCYVYFDHSYYVRPLNSKDIAGTTNYGGEFSSMIWKDNIYGTQFHPEKSQKIGLQLLSNFGKLN